jgi:hypothetical protein
LPDAVTEENVMAGYTVRLKTTRGSEGTGVIQRFKEAIAADMDGSETRKKRSSVVGLDQRTYSYTVDAVDTKSKLIWATVDNNK